MTTFRIPSIWKIARLCVSLREKTWSLTSKTWSPTTRAWSPELKKLVFDGQNLVFAGKKLVCPGTAAPTLQKIVKMCELLAGVEFGVAELITQMPRSSAIALMAKMKTLNLIHPTAHRGKYTFSIL